MIQPRLRVLVVEDSLTVRRRLCEILSSTPGFEVVGEAEDGAQAIELCRTRMPDVVSMDMILPVMSGLAATEYIMANFPTPILVVSASTNRGELFQTYDALAAGAVDVLEKPRGDDGDDLWAATFVARLRRVARIKVIRHPRARLAAFARPSAPRDEPSAAPVPRGGVGVVALGASTGGPGALVQVLRGIERELTIPILVVLHIAEPFGAAFADWLGEQIPIRVEQAREGAPISTYAGAVALAPPGRHLIVRDGRARLTEDPERHSCRPSVDVLFESLAQERGVTTLACLLTGMGRDGAAGLLAIRRAGGRTIAQDEATSMIYGMPREAVLLGAAESVLPLQEIGPAIAAIVPGRAKERWR